MTQKERRVGRGREERKGHMLKSQKMVGGEGNIKKNGNYFGRHETGRCQTIRGLQIYDIQAN